MNYYYDIVLNFLDDNTLFYEWDELDNIEYIKKIPLFHVKSSVFDDFYNYNVKVNDDFLKDIENKTNTKNGKLLYSCILADKNNAFAYEFDKNGNVITRSSLVLADELNLLDYLYTVSVKDLEYVKKDKIKANKELRMCSKIKKFIKLEVDKLYKEDKLDKLKYLYLEWFNKKENNKDKMYKEMKNKLKKDINEEEIKIYNIIKLSYNNV